MKYIKVRGVLRAKNGSQIPKFSGGTWKDWFIWSQGNQIPTELDDATNTVVDANGLRRIPLMLEPKFTNWTAKLPENAELLYKEALFKKTLDDTLKPKVDPNNKSKEKKKFGETKFGKGAAKFGEGISNFIIDNSGAILDTANVIAKDSVDILGDSFGKFSNGLSNIRGFANNFGETGRAVGDMIGIVDTWANVINALGSTRLQDFSVNKELQARMGGAYSGSYMDINKAGNMAGKTVGWFGGAGNRNNFIDKLQVVQAKIAEIDKTNQDYQARVNDSIYQNYSNLQNGLFNPINKLTFAAKLGGILDKVNWIKSRRKLNQVVNVNTKQIEEFKDGGVLDWEPIIEWEPVIETYQEGGKLEKSNFEDWFNSIPKSNRANQYDYRKAYEVFDWKTLSNHAKDPENHHLYSVSPIADEIGNYPFLKLGKVEDNPEIQGEFDWYNSEEGKEHKSKFDIEYINDRYYYIPKKFKEGGKTKEDAPEIEETSQKNLIPEGALHKNKHHIEHTEGLTLKGIPVIDNEGELLAEIEHSEIIFTLEVTKKLEELYKEGTDEAAIKAGKLLVKEILFNTDDRMNLIAKCLEGGKL